MQLMASTRSLLYRAASRHRSSIPDPHVRPRLTRSFSSGGPPGAGIGKGRRGLGKVVLVGGVAALSSIGGTLGYAGMDPEFRKYVADIVPGAKEVFDSILGESDGAGREDSTNRGLEVSKSKLRPIVVTTTPEKNSEAAVRDPIGATKKKEGIPTASSSSTSSTVIEPPLEKFEIAGQTPDPNRPISVVPEAGKEAIVATIQGGAEHIGLKLALEETTSKLMQTIDFALKAGESCIGAITKHRCLIEKVLEREVSGDRLDEDSWNDVFEAANNKSKLLSSAQSTINEAKAGVKRVVEIIEMGQKRSSSEDEIILSVANAKVNDAIVAIQDISTRLEDAQNQSRIMEKYREFVEEGKQQFRKEIAALLPDSKIFGNGKDSEARPLSKQELDLFITHAYKKICQLQQELAKQKTITMRHLQSTVQDEQVKAQILTEEIVHSELEAQRRSLEAEHQRKMTAIREEMENEVRAQLRRQAGAHGDHVKDALDVQSTELGRRFERDLEEALSNERANCRREVAALSGKVDGLKKAVVERSKLQLAIRDAQELWLACCALQRGLQTERPVDGELLPLNDQVKAIRAMAKDLAEGDKFVQTVLDSMPVEAVHRGVYTAQTIRDRFFKVEKVAKRTALVEEAGGSMLLYLMSFVQSFLVASPSTVTMPDTNSPLNVDELSTFDILWLARGSVERGELEQAVKYMTLLKGMPRIVSTDWIREARILLETKQACDIILSHAAAFGLEALPGKFLKEKENVMS